MLQRPITDSTVLIAIDDQRPIMSSVKLLFLRKCSTSDRSTNKTNVVTTFSSLRRFTMPRPANVAGKALVSSVLQWCEGMQRLAARRNDRRAVQPDTGAVLSVQRSR